VLNFNGAYAQYLKMSGRHVHRLTRDADLNQACLIEPLAVVLRGVRKLLSGESGAAKNVAVIGHGTIGNLCAQVMAHKGHRVTVFDKNPLRLKNIKDLRITAETDVNGLQRFDHVIEATGQAAALKNVLAGSRTGAKLLLLGLPYEKFEFNFESIVCFDKTVIGSVGSSARDFVEAIGLYPSLDLGPLTASVFSLQDYAQAWEQQKKGEVVKAILKVTEGV
jgi:threonine dehydrogenase-like Zn-dependent dehydrogenase